MTKQVNRRMPGVPSVGDLRDVLIIAGFFLFFTGWIYVYYFYDYFGISLSLVEVDYTSYLVYSFVVLTSCHWLPMIALLLITAVFIKWFAKLFTLCMLVCILFFPALYGLASYVATSTAENLRRDPDGMRHISFLFKSDAEFLSCKLCTDSIPGNAIVKTDVARLKAVPGDLYLLGQNQEYFFVLEQQGISSKVGPALPIGTIYFVNKSLVLYSKIVITSNSK